MVSERMVETAKRVISVAIARIAVLLSCDKGNGKLTSQEKELTDRKAAVIVEIELDVTPEGMVIGSAHSEKVIEHGILHRVLFCIRIH